MKNILKRIGVILIVLVLVLATVFVFWANDASSADEVALSALNSDSQTTVTIENGWATFYPADNARPETGFILYPGGKVDYRAYAPILNRIADEGYFVVVVPVPLNLAFFDMNAAARVQAAYPEIKNWFVGGHSLGGVVASSFAASHSDIRGVVLWASGPANDALKVNDVPTISIYGSNDGALSDEMKQDAKGLLPEGTKIVVIEGGNHAQFGSYGFQAGDREASISPEEQWSQAVAATVEFFKTTLSGN